MPRIHWIGAFVALLEAVSLFSVTFPVEGAVVITEPEVRLRQGLPGSVPCTVTRKLSAVYWKRGDTIENATTVVTLDISSNKEDISGPGLDDRRFTVASNYSLIFNNARSEDSGRYFCEVSDSESVYWNHSIVTVFDPPVITDDRRVLQYGDQAILGCQYDEAVYGVSWRKGERYADGEPLVALNLRHDKGQREFPENNQGGYDISDDYSLIINSTRIRDGGWYWCVVSDRATGRRLDNSTYVEVVATPNDPFPEIDTCMPISTNESVQTCEISEDSNTTISLTCTVKRYYPSISLSFSGTSNVTSTIRRSISINPEGLFTQVVTIELSVGTKEVSCGTSMVRTDPVVCTANGPPFRTTRTTEGVFTSTTTTGNQGDRGNAGALCARGNSTCIDPPVITDARRVLQYGDRAILRCQYEEPACAIYWLKGDTYADAERVVVLDLFYEINQGKGPGHDQVGYNISEDYSLVINSTRIRDRGRYFCAVSDLATGRLLVNSTYVDVVATPQEAFPEIDTCVLISTNESVRICEISEDSNTTISLTCTVKGYYPYISLSFSDTSNMASMIQRAISNDTEGLLTQVVTIELLVRTDPVTCTVSGLSFRTSRTTQGVFTPTTTTGNHTNDVITSTVRGNGAVTAAAVSVVVIFVILAVVIAGILYRKRFRKRGHLVSFVELWYLVSVTEQADSLAEAIKDLKGINIPMNAKRLPGMYTSPEAMYSLSCKWKNECKEQNQLKDLFQCLRNHRLENEVSRFKEFRAWKDCGIPHNMIRRLISGINNIQNVNSLIQALRDNGDVKPGKKGHKVSSNSDAITFLRQWSRSPSHRRNPLVSLCLAAERARCKPTDREFFRDFDFTRWKFVRSPDGPNYFEETELSDELLGEDASEQREVESRQ